MPKIAELVKAFLTPLQAKLLCDGESSPSYVPLGGIIIFPSATVPSGFLLCNGQAVSRTTYARLFALIGTGFGIGDGSTTFNIPSFKGRFPLGKADSGTGSILGNSGGLIDHTHTVPAHYHSGLNAKESSAASGTSGDNIVSNNSGGTRAFGSTTIGATGGVSGDAQMTSGTANPPFLTINYMIRY